MASTQFTFDSYMHLVEKLGSSGYKVISYQRANRLSETDNSCYVIMKHGVDSNVEAAASFA